MSTITVTTDCGTTRKFDDHRAAREGKETHTSLCDECTEDDVQVSVDPAQTTLDPLANGGGRDDTGTEAGGESSALEIPDSVRVDPLDVVPEYMITEVEGQPTINKRGYAAIAHHYDIVVRSEAITAAGETDHEFAEFKATAWRRGESPEEGYTGHGTARAAEDRRGIENNLNEMAETRAMKRAVAWASGVGLLAWEEMAEYVDDGSPDAEAAH